MTFQEIKEFESPCPILITSNRFTDERGYFNEIYKYSAFKQHGIPEQFVQSNVSVSDFGVLRGLHFQRPPKPQGKLVHVLAGHIFDVAIDIRKNSKTFMKYVSVDLSSKIPQLFYIPPGYAHGFLSLSNGAIVHYQCTNEYDPTLDACIRWDDADININWPYTLNLIISEKDRNAKMLRDTNGLDTW